MNIVLPVDIQSYIPSKNVTGTEQARAENSARPVIEPAQHNSASKHSSQKQNEQSLGFAHQVPKHASKDKVSLSKQGQEASKHAENNDESKTELSEDDKKKVQDLKDRDREVKVHEQAHAAVGGQYAGSPSYEYETGPDGRRYAVGGEVSIDVSAEKEPEDTVQKMQIVRAAALAPAEPSSQDLKVAAEASQQEQQARAQVSEKQLDSDKKPEEKNRQSEENSVAPNSASPQQSKLAQSYADFSASRIQSQFSASA